MSSVDFVKIAALGNTEEFREALAALSIALPCDDAIHAAPISPLARPATVLGRQVGNRFCVQPMEGWDGTPDGRPTEKTFRRWMRFGTSGAKLIWGGEAVAVRHDGRANPCQLLLTHETKGDIAHLRETLVNAHQRTFGTADDLLLGLQLTHSGRFARPNRWDQPEPVLVYHHPLLDKRVGVNEDYPLLSDSAVHQLVEDFVQAARLAYECGFDFVDIKQCHGYLGHEFLSAHTRKGSYGGPLENRARFFREVVEGIRSEVPGLGIATRVSVFDTVPYRPDPDRAAPGKLGPGIPESYCDWVPYLYAFGVDPEQPTEMALQEPLEYMSLLRTMGVTMLNVTAGSPYYSHHIQRPALYPPSDGYQPPEDPLIGLARLLYVAHLVKERNPDFVVVGTGYTYLQEFLPNVAQATVREGWVDFVGLGRIVLSYPELPRDVLEGRPLNRKQICRTFSDCTNAPRAGLASGCYPLDPYYRTGPMAEKLRQAKDALRKRLGG